MCSCNIDVQRSEPGVCGVDQSCASGAAALRTFCSEPWNTHVFNYLFPPMYLFLIELKDLLRRFQTTFHLKKGEIKHFILNELK